MGGIESLVLIVVVVQAVWILSSLFRGGGDDDKKAAQARANARRAAGDSARPRSTATNVDRFLEEINRRRREIAEQEQAASARTEAPPLVRPRPSPAEREMPRRRPEPRPVVVTPPPARTRATATRPVLAQPVVEAVVVETGVPQSPAADKVAAVVTQRPVLPGSPAVAARAMSPAMKQLLPFLENRQNVRIALVINEIFGQPVGQRPVGQASD
jgi:hypothetical protein